ncbi:MAG TPA: OmpH family outer membrane protein [Verrucomicrobiae bacterium]
MKKFSALIVAAAVLVVALSASAQTKIASVDMKKLFNGYYKTKMAQAALDKEKTDLRKELQDMADSLKKAQADYKQTLDQANDQAISADERDKRKVAAQEKAKDVSSRQVAIEQYQRQAETQLQDKSQRMVGNLVKEIQEVVSNKAKAAGYDLVVNGGNPDSFVYVGANVDITASVLTQLNAGQPIDVVAPTTNSAAKTGAATP